MTIRSTRMGRNKNQVKSGGCMRLVGCDVNICPRDTTISLLFATIRDIIFN
jgi:hypothetical protein